MRHEPPAELFSTAQARAAGWSDAALCRAVRAGRLQRVRPGVYGTPGHQHEQGSAAALAWPGTPLSHLSAARVFGAPVVGCRDALPDVTVPPRAGGDRPGVHIHRARLRPHEITVRDGTLLTTPARTAVDIARHRPLMTSVAVIDYVLHEGLATPDELVDVFDFCRTWPGGRRARRALRLADSRAESPLESVSRLVLPSLGLPAPEPQVTIVDSCGRFVGRGDLYWDDVGVLGEADGREKYGSRDDLFDEKGRQEDLENTGLEVTRWGWQLAWSDRVMLRARVRAAFDRGSARDATGLPRRWTAVSTPRLVVPI